MSSKDRHHNPPPIELRRALAVLNQTGPLTTGDLARAFGVTDRDTHILMLTAESNRLVYRTPRGAWAITDRGRDALSELNTLRRRRLAGAEPTEESSS